MIKCCARTAGPRVDLTMPTHRYLSTACLHEEHEYCNANVRPDGVSKVPATCKFCGAGCICTCHEKNPAPEGRSD